MLSTTVPHLAYMETIAVIVASFGDKTFWDSLAARALKSVYNQSRPPDELIRTHGPSLHEARNDSAFRAKSDFLCFLDCDDALEPGYLEAMMAPGKRLELRYPMVRYVSSALVNEKYVPDPVALTPRPLRDGNFMVIGTVVSRDIFIQAGGFRDLRAYEDWDLWIRCWLLGCDPCLIEKAIYRIYQRPDSRNAVKNPQVLCEQIVNYNRKWNRERMLCKSKNTPPELTNGKGEAQGVQEK